MLVLLNSMNAYLGAWVTAGIALGGVIFSVIQSIVNAAATYFSAKMKSDHEVEIEKQKTIRQANAAKQAEVKAIKNTFNDYYVQTSIAIYQKQKSDAQILAYAKLLNYVSEIGFNSKISTIQDAVTQDNFTYADSQFQKYLPELRLEEKQLLLQLGQPQPTERKDDSAD